MFFHVFEFVKLDRLLLRFNVTVTKRQSLCQSFEYNTKFKHIKRRNEETIFFIIFDQRRLPASFFVCLNQPVERICKQKSTTHHLTFQKIKKKKHHYQIHTHTQIQVLHYKYLIKKRESFKTPFLFSFCSKKALCYVKQHFVSIFFFNLVPFLVFIFILVFGDKRKLLLK